MGSAIARLLPIHAIRAKRNSEEIANVTQEILMLQDDDLACCSWGLSWASMVHKMLYSRLFRS